MQNNIINQQILLAVATLKAGNLIAFPTETVYGLGANARDPSAVAKVFAAKNRPADHPLIVHIADIAQLPSWVKQIPTTAIILAKHFWPGPLTLILPKHDSVDKIVTGGQDSVAIRIPKHPLTLSMLKLFDGGIVGPSANTHCSISPTTAAHVKEDLGNKVDFILDGGPCEVGIESTILYFMHDKPYIARYGGITATEIAEVLAIDPLEIQSAPSTIKVPGNLKLHYAPKKPLFLLTNDALILAVKQYLQQEKEIAVLSFKPSPEDLNSFCHWQEMPANAKQYAQILYTTLHKLDKLAISAILVEAPPPEISWQAVTDRLNRSKHN